MKRKLGIIVGSLLLSTTMMYAGIFDMFKSFNYISAEETAELIRTKPDSIVLVDIQVKDGFAKEHLRGAIETNAYPVKKQDELDRLAAVLPNIHSDQKVIIVCPRGGGGAERAYKFYLENNINKDKLLILSNGQDGWPRDEITDVLAK